MTPRDTERSSRKAQQFHRSAKSGTPELRPLPAREWLASKTGFARSVEREDFAGEDLVSAHLDKIIFRHCGFVSADLRQADLRGSFFRDTDFSDANLIGADLANAHFESCDFSGAKLDNVMTLGAHFDKCRGLPGV